MTAKEMFETLGYKQTIGSIYIAYEDTKDLFKIIFWLDDRYYSTRDDFGDWVSVSLHGAITKQMQELGWIE